MNTRQRGRPRLQEAAEIDRAIREAAVATLLEHGDAATMNAIAEAAGLSRKSVYARYATKSALFIDAIRDLMALARPVEYAAAGTPEQRLYSFIRTALALISTPNAKAVQAILTADPSYIAVLRAEMIDAVKTQFYEPLQALLGALVDSGEIIAVDIPHTAQAINTLIFGFGSGYQDEVAGRAGARSLDDHARLLTDFVTRGILPRPGCA